jgi:hypothetical protein
MAAKAWDLCSGVVTAGSGEHVYRDFASRAHPGDEIVAAKAALLGRAVDGARGHAFAPAAVLAARPRVNGLVASATYWNAHGIHRGLAAHACLAVGVALAAGGIRRGAGCFVDALTLDAILETAPLSVFSAKTTRREAGSPGIAVASQNTRTASGTRHPAP